MKQLFKSEITGKVYDSEQECLDAEKEHQALIAKKDKEKEDRKLAADEIKKAYEEYVKLCSDDRKKEQDVYNHYVTLRDEFIDKYGSYHLTVTQKNDSKPVVRFGFDELDNLVKSFFDNFWNF